MGKEYGRHELSSIQSLIFVSVCVIDFSYWCFLTSVGFLIFIHKAFFRGSLPIQKYLSAGNFCNCLPTERVFTEQAVRISL